MSRLMKVFISSKMVELRDERKVLETLLPTLGDETVRLSPWIFETDAPASGSSIRSVYLKALEESELYIGLFWNEFGEWTIDEFHRAGELGITRHVYVKNVNPEARDSRLVTFLDKQSDVRFGVTPRWFTDLDDLKLQISRSVEQWLLERQVAYHSATSAIIADIPDDIPERPPRRLIGRDELVNEVMDLLVEDHERILLRGFGGMGKTALAVSIASQWLKEEHGKVIWIRAGAVDENAIFEALGRAFDEQQTVARAIGDERVKVIRRLLSRQQALLVLDDVWNGTALAQVEKALPHEMPFLVTSRQFFPLGEIIEVGELKPESALKLLNSFVRRRDLSEDPDAKELCELLGYHAFALEIAGNMLKVYNITPADLLQRIEDAPHDLDMPAGFGELGRTGIKAIMDTSINALNQKSYEVFLHLGSLFEPTGTAELVALTMNQEESDTTSSLIKLEEHGLAHQHMHKEITYFHLHDLAYSYARTMFLNKGLSQQPVVDACRTYTLNHKNDLDALDVEQSNILEAAEAAHETERGDIFVDIIRLLTLDGSYFAARGHTSQTMRLLSLAIEVALGQDELETAHHFLSKLGNTYTEFTGEYTKAFEAYRRAYELAQKLEKPQREAVLLTVMGKVRHLQEAGDAEDYYNRAEQVARDLGDEFALCFVLHYRGFHLINQENPDFEKSCEFSRQAADIARRLDFQELLLSSLINLGGGELELGHQEQALHTHQEAYAIAESNGNYPWMASALQSIGEDFHYLKKTKEAQDAFDRALTLWRQTGAKAQAKILIDYMEKNDYIVQPE